MPLFGPNIAKLQATGDVDGLIRAIDHSRPTCGSARPANARYLPQERLQEATQWHLGHFHMDRMTFT